MYVDLAPVLGDRCPMITFLIVIAVPTLLAILGLIFFKKKVTWIEFGIQIGVAFLLAGAGIALSYYSRIQDTELWNGQITKKQMERVSCSHSYSCNCHTTSSGSGKNRTTSTYCDTCYEHRYDQDWNLYSSTGESMSVDRVDRQGLDEPQRYGQAYVGEPWTSQHSFENYILANPGDVINSGMGNVSKFKALIPTYPQVYDLYRADHFILAGNFPDFDKKDWSYLVNQIDKRLGPTKQANVMVIVVQTADPDYFWALKSAWVGGKKNDAIILIGSEDGHKILWADVLSWSPRADYKVKLRDTIIGIGNLDMRDAIVEQIESQTNSNFERLHMKTMKYLVASSEMPMNQVLLLALIVTLIQIGIGIWAIKNDITEDSDGFTSSETYRF